MHAGWWHVNDGGVCCCRRLMRSSRSSGRWDRQQRRRGRACRTCRPSKTPPNPLPFSSHCKLLAVLCIMQAMPSNKCPSEPPIKRLCSDHNHLAPKPWHCPGQAEFNVPAGATEHGFLTVHSAARGSKKAKVNVPRAPRGLMIGTASTLTGG